MTKQYKVGDKVLVVGTVRHILEPTNLKNRYSVEVDDNGGWHRIPVDDDVIRPYTPRQEFEYGEEVLVNNVMSSGWIKALYIGKDHNDKSGYPYLANALACSHGDVGCKNSYKYIKKLNAPPCETITIGSTTYNKAEFENAVKDLKPVEEK